MEKTILGSTNTHTQLNANATGEHNEFGATNVVAFHTIFDSDIHTITMAQGHTS
jgi:hypothetical protein